jgi:hypothetical protein
LGNQHRVLRKKHGDRVAPVLIGSSKDVDHCRDSEKSLRVLR